MVVCGGLFIVCRLVSVSEFGIMFLLKLLGVLVLVFILVVSICNFWEVNILVVCNMVVWFSGCNVLLVFILVLYRLSMCFIVFLVSII